MRIAFYKASRGNWIDRGVALTTLSIYSHCEIIFSDGIAASASLRDKGVRFKQINFGDKWDVYELKVPETQERLARAFFNLHEGARYDLLGAVGAGFRLDLGHDAKFYCSEICAIVLGENPHASPGSLFRRLYHTGKI
jgi:hypothetical protein